MRISAVILTKNEEKNIKDCIDSLKFCDEIIVIDDSSDDNTVRIAESSGAKVYSRKLNNNFAAQRNYALDNCSGEWILFTDADERVTEGLASEILNIQTTQYVGFYIKREDTMLGKRLKHGEFWTNSFLRLAKKGEGKWKRAVHEYWDIKGKIGRINSPLLHYSHQTLNEFIAEVNWYSSLHAEANLKEKKKSNIFKIMFYPKLKFIDNWIIKGGFQDGTEGFVAALMMSLHSFLAWSKQWIKQQES